MTYQLLTQGVYQLQKPYETVRTIMWVPPTQEELLTTPLEKIQGDWEEFRLEYLGEKHSPVLDVMEGLVIATLPEVEQPIWRIEFKLRNTNLFFSVEDSFVILLYPSGHDEVVTLERFDEMKPTLLNTQESQSVCGMCFAERESFYYEPVHLFTCVPCSASWELLLEK